VRIIMTAVSPPRWSRSLAAAALALSAFLPVLAADPVLGASRYAQDCAGCHGATPLTSNQAKIFYGRNSASVIDSGISAVGDMQGLRSAYPAGSAQIADIAAYLGNAPSKLTFPSTTVGASSANLTVTVSASLKSGYSIANLIITTTGDYTRSGGTCGTTVNTGSNCTVFVAFKPLAAGTRTGKLNIAHSRLPTPAVIALSGSGAAVPAPIASVTPTSLAFASTATGSTSASKTVTLSNTGNKTLTLGTIGSSSAEFKLAGGTCVAGGTVLAGARCTVLMSFKPSVVGARSGTLSIAHNAVGSPSKVTMTGTATAKPVAALTPTSLAFGNQVVLTTSLAKTLTLKNTGTAGLKITTIAVTPADYKVAGGTCKAAATIAVAASCTVTVTFKPATTGLKSGTLTITHNAAVTTSKASLSGTGVVAALGAGAPLSAASVMQPPPAGRSVNGAAALSLNHSALDFLPQLTGTAGGGIGSKRTVTLTNSGAADLKFSEFNLVGDAAGDFDLGGSCNIAEALPAGASCSIVLGFQPAEAGERSATLNIVSDAGSAAVSVRGEGAAKVAAAITLSPAALDFGRQSLGAAPAARQLTLTNSGSAPLGLARLSAAAPFAASHRCPASLAPGAACRITVTYTPRTVADSAGLLTIEPNGGTAPVTLALAGSAAAGLPVLAWRAATPDSVDFGEVPAGSQATAGQLWLNNRGPGPVELMQFNVSGAEAGEFTVANGGSCVAGSRLAQGASCSVNLAFQPLAAGPRSAMLEVTSSGSSPHAVTLAGQGSATTHGALRLTPTALNLNGTEPQTVTLHNEGNAVLNVARVAVANGDFVIDDASADGCQSTAFDLMPGQSCTLQLRAAATPAAGDTGPQAGALEVSTDAAADPVRMILSASRTADTQVAANDGLAAAGDTSNSNDSTGGCSIASGASATDPVLWLLVLAAVVVLALRRRPD